jgi:acetate kinase
MGKIIIRVNAGSSSIKLAIADASTLETLYSAEEKNVTDFRASSRRLIELTEQKVDLFEVVAIGHRIVHGGSQAHTAREINDEVLASMHAFAEFDPMHATSALALVETMSQLFPDAKQVACFDTAFFHDIPKVAQLIALPRKYRDAGVRRYGFHGLSYIYVLGQLRNHGIPVDKEKIVIAHLGSGASLAAIQHGAPVDMTMGFTPTSGIVMSSRLGDTDPSILGFLQRQFGTTIEEWTTLTNKESGLLAVSELSADMYALVTAQQDNPQAKEAVELFIYKVRQAIGSLAASMNGIDRLVFTGGIGEASDELRGRILEGLSFLQIPSTVVVPTNENEVIFSHVKALL